MFWSIAPLVLACIVLAGLVGMCAFAPGGTNRGPVPSYDAAGALRADAQTLGFPGPVAAAARRLAAELRQPRRYRRWSNRPVDRSAGPRGHLYRRLHQPHRHVPEPDPKQRRRGQAGRRRSTLRRNQLCIPPEPSTSTAPGGSSTGRRRRRAGVDDSAEQCGRSGSGRHHRCRGRRPVSYAGGGHSIAAAVTGSAVEGTRMTAPEADLTGWSAAPFTGGGLHPRCLPQGRRTRRGADPRDAGHPPRRAGAGQSPGGQRVHRRDPVAVRRTRPADFGRLRGPHHRTWLCGKGIRGVRDATSSGRCRSFCGHWPAT